VFIKSGVHPSIPQGERFPANVSIWFSVRGERFDFAHRPEQVEGVSNHEQKWDFGLFTGASTRKIEKQ
jgi:hypothetical protein